MLANTHSGVHYRRRTRSWEIHHGNKPVLVQRMLPHASRLLAANTTLRKGPCIPGTQQGCAGVLRTHMDCLSQEQCCHSLRSRYNCTILSIKSGCVLHRCRIDHAFLTVAENPDTAL